MRSITKTADDLSQYGRQNSPALSVRQICLPLLTLTPASAAPFLFMTFPLKSIFIKHLFCFIYGKSLKRLFLLIYAEIFGCELHTVKVRVKVYSLLSRLINRHGVGEQLACIPIQSENQSDGRLIPRFDS